MKSILSIAFVATVICGGSVSPVLADAAHGKAMGMPGKASDVQRTITVTLRDIAFAPENISVKPGETVRFVIRNEGSLLHEFNIGTPSSHQAHQKEMMQMMEMGMLTPTGLDPEKMKMDHGGTGPMKHDDPNTVLVEPGKMREMNWRFDKATTLEFACNIPGHYQAGMVGQFRFSH
mgnify:CR=1 FL=1